VRGASGDQQRGIKRTLTVEAGLRDEISPNLDLTTEYRFSQAEAAKFSGIADTANQHFSDHLLSVGFTYHLSPGGW
jgi:opacity protein-like surface antigen